MAANLKSKLDRLHLREFRPLPPLLNGHAQTIGGLYFPQRRPLAPTAAHDIVLSDGDRLRVIENRPVKWRDGDPIALLFHGLTGSAQSTYMIRLDRKLCERGILVYRVNHRGCGEGYGLARGIYHSGRSEDAIAAHRWTNLRHPRSEVTWIGFSLGGNVVLKAAGEVADQELPGFANVIAISPPADLAACAHRLRTAGRFFDWHFVETLTADLKRRHQKFPDLGELNLPRRGLTLTQLDSLYTAPHGGFKDAADYYTRSSAKLLLRRIARPGLILSAIDDPIIDSRAFDELAMTKSPVETFVLKQGGHVGFVGRDDRSIGFRWMDALIVRWLDDRTNA